MRVALEVAERLKTQDKKIWTHFQKYYRNLAQKEYTPLQHVLSISALSLPSKTKKLVLTLTITIHVYLENKESITIW